MTDDSFPLYAKGVERYRYEYAVFLLNKNIEMVSGQPTRVDVSVHAGKTLRHLFSRKVVSPIPSLDT